jgi:DNA-binding NarL/FixJ family response regulator
VLSKRQVEVARLRAAGLSLKDAAFELGVSYKTASVHAYQLYKKIGVHSRSEILSELQRLRLAPQPGFFCRVGRSYLQPKKVVAIA